MDVGQDTALSNRHMTQKFVQFLVVADGKLEMTGNNTSLLVITSGISSQLKNLSSEILQDCSEIDRGTFFRKFSYSSSLKKSVEILPAPTRWA